MGEKVKFRRGGLSAFQSQTTYDTDAFSVVNKVKSSSDTTYSRLYLGGDMVGCGHRFIGGDDGSDGLVPYPRGTIGTTRYLCEDGYWSIPDLCKAVRTTASGGAKVYYPLVFKYSVDVSSDDTNYIRFSSKALGSSNGYHLSTTADGEMMVRDLTTDLDIFAGGAISAIQNISTSNGYFVGLLYPNANLSDASILTLSNQPLTTLNSPPDDRPVTAANVVNYVSSQIEWGTWSNP